MIDPFWAPLRRLQSHHAHGTFRPLLMEVLREENWDDWGAFSERLGGRGCDLEMLMRSAPDSEREVFCEVERLHRMGVSCLTPRSPDYPAQWFRSADPPLTLTVLGRPSVLSRQSLSVVGSREPSVHSMRWMENELHPFCASQRIPIVSGGARGIDQKAHSVALRSGSPTIVFLPSGIEVPYPMDIRNWFEPICEGGGCIVSEYPPGTPMRKQHFHHRNRLIATLSGMVVVVEARQKSGTMMTALRAAEVGRPLLVVPGHPQEIRYAGNLELLLEGATMLRHKEDLLFFWQSEMMFTGSATNI